MNLLMMLELANRPWVVVQDPQRKRAGNPKPNNRLANEAKRAKAYAKYSAAAKGEWVTPAMLAIRMGMDRSCVSETLRGWHKAGTVEKRTFNNEPYHHKKGFEFLFIKEQP